MKKLWMFLFAALFFSAPLSAAPEEVRLKIEGIFSVQNGFDSNDRIEVAVWGYLPSSCHRLGKGSARVDMETKSIFVRVDGFLRTNNTCTTMISPFLEVIQLGHLPQGEFGIFAEHNPEVTSRMFIKPGTEHQDDFLYAPVDTVELSMINTFASGSQHLTLQGTYPWLLKGCMRITDVRTYITSGNVLVVQPISRIFDDPECNPEDVDGYNRFKVVKRIETPILEKGMVHVRTLNGRAMNKFVDFTLD